MKSVSCSVVAAMLFLAINATAQKQPQVMRSHPVPDTIFVYDTLFVTDTIRLIKTVPTAENLPFRVLSSLQSDQQPQKILIISPGFAATISKDLIISSEKNSQFKNSEKMKKIGFFGVILFAFQNIILSQNDIAINIGAGGYRLNSNYSSIKTNIAPMFSTGVGYSHRFAKGNFNWNVDLNYHFMLRSDFDAAQTLPVTGTAITGENFKQNYHLFNLPVSLQWNAKWFSPLAGIEAYYKLSPRIAQTFTNSATGEIVTQKYRVPYVGASWLIGLKCPLSNRLIARFAYFRGITKEFTAQYGGSMFQTKMQRMELSLRYQLK